MTTALDFGVEIECLLPSTNAGQLMTNARLAELITATGVPCYAEGYNHGVRRHWKIVTDGSLHPGPGKFGLELVSPPLSDAGFEDISKICEILGSLGGSVNRTCGLHVHHLARNLSVPVLKKLAELYVTHEPVIDTLLPASRRGNNNSYCRSLTSTSLTQLAAANSINQIEAAISSGQRFYKLNFLSFWRHGTVEFRHHSGTVSADKIIKWVMFTHAMIETAKKEASNPVAVGGTDPRAHPYWRGGGRRRRALFRMLTRGEGVTRPELAAELHLNSLPLIRRHLIAVGAPAPTRHSARRGGHEVYRLPHAVAATAAAPTTLEGLCAKLELSAEDKAYWAARVASFTPGGQDREALAAIRHEMERPAPGATPTNPTVAR